MKKQLTGLILSAAMLTGCDETDTKPVYTDDYSAPDYLIEFGKMFQEGVQKASDAPVWLYTNVNGGIPNTVVIEGDTGLIIVDTTLKLEDGQKTLEMIRERTRKPVKAVIYTHHHNDHVGGAAAFVDPADARAGTVPVIAAANFVREMQDENAVTIQIMGMRALYMYGTLLDDDTDGRNYHVGLGGRIKPGTMGYVEPNTFVDGTQEMTIDGIRMELFQTGGEAASHIGIYLPDYEMILSGDEIQGPTFPNLHSLRGTKPRDANAWIDAIDHMRAYNPKVMVPSHGPIVEGRDEVEHIFRTYRDAIQWTHDQAVRLINQGYTQEELAEALPRLPEHLTITPWTREVYGTVKHSVRNYFTGYISWFDGDAATLDPTPRTERARRTVALMGGRDRVYAEAEKAMAEGDPQWASELLTHLVRIDHDDTAARALKARAFRQIGYKTLNTNWRGFYLTGAKELDGDIDSVAIQENLRKRFNASAIPSDRLLSLMRYKLVPEEAAGKALTVSFVFPDRDEAFTLELRSQILVVHEGLKGEPNATLTLDRTTYDRMIRGEVGFAGGLMDGDIQLDGSKLDVLAFFGSFDLDTKAIPLVVR
ncbi:alkyl sulfatase dimerization domain-containing protein [Kordiimonas lacus]|uniref:Alkyl sulfatase BDS1, metallo-beta-lactamase superfamily n=1 Tax=Kordiimonas lacus TaxID=637679 RepID=A0A1G7BCR9_9PROT|nr:alkyl sulfatase dimerization domain-containing protein [Kordiimonas lacus]SDE24717.1 Alkyl sulfatase BDS1, metallo-beta-lactamase superfamily [Kordiimonas lacus]